VDHFGLAADLVDASGAQVWTHPWNLPTLNNSETYREQRVSFYGHLLRQAAIPAEMLSAVEDVRPDHREQESAQVEREACVDRLLDRLDKRERQIVTSRFGLTRGQEPLKLKQVGATIGVSKERVRQIQCRAIGKLRKAAEEDHIEDAV
jgi:RNA polymerase primary sigma factor/RNA polymerase sigma factor